MSFLICKECREYQISHRTSYFVIRALCFVKFRQPIQLNSLNSLRAREGFIQPTFYKRFDCFSFINHIKWIKKTVVSCEIELTKISVTKGWSDQEVNAQIDKDLNPKATRPNFHRDIIYT